MSASPGRTARERGRQPSGARTGRRRGSSPTRGSILEASRTVFGERGYEGATIRLIASRADVDPALIYHYFGSKQQLFVAAMEIPGQWRSGFLTLADGPRDRIGERLVRLMLGTWEDPAVRPVFMGLMRSAVSDRHAADMLRELLAEGPLTVLGRATGSPDGDLRAMLAGSHLMGIAMLRFVLRVEPVASADIETLVRMLSPAIQHYLTGELATATP